jgi:hypothetical protein
MNPMTRRSFLARCGALAAASTVPSFFVRADTKSGSALPIVGSGEHTYECVHDWLVPPDGMVFGDTHGVCQDADGNIYVTHTVNHASKRGEAIVVYDSKGQFVRAFGERFRGGAHGLTLRREGASEVLYHCDINRCNVVKTSLTGEELWIHGYPNEDPPYQAAPIPFVPTNVAFAPNGDFFVGDGYGSSRMLRFSASGAFLGEIGSPGKEDGQFATPHGQWLDTRRPEPVLMVADRSNHRFQVFDLEGKHLRTVTDEARIRLPCFFDIRGDLTVCADLDSQVTLLDRNYAVIAQLGDGQAINGKVGSRRDQARSQFTPGKFITPHAAIFLASGDILVAEWLPIGRLTLLRKV